MPPRRRAPTPIPIDVESVRRKLAEGKIVRVGISRSAQFPDGGTGRVRHIGDPGIDGEEYIQVELSLNGTRDVLPFTPADLTPATRSKTQPTVDAQVGGRASLGTAAVPKAVPSRAREPAASRAPGGSSGIQTSTLFPDVDSTEVAITATARSSTDALPPAATAPPSASAAARPKPARGTKRTPAVAISVATTDTEPPQWRIEAKVGARVVLRSGSVSPARVWELVQMLDDETLTRAVGTVLDEQRKAAQMRADALSAELAQVQAELAALPDGRA